MILTKAIREIFPEVDFELEVVVRDDGDGTAAYVAFWDLMDPQPSETDLAEAWLRVIAKEAKKEEDWVVLVEEAREAKNLHEMLEGGDWTIGEVKEIIAGILDRLDFLEQQRERGGPLRRLQGDP